MSRYLTLADSNGLTIRDLEAFLIRAKALGADPDVVVETDARTGVVTDMTAIHVRCQTNDRPTTESGGWENPKSQPTPDNGLHLHPSHRVDVRVKSSRRYCLGCGHSVMSARGASVIGAEPCRPEPE